jgi:hypothetical protein
MFRPAVPLISAVFAAAVCVSEPAAAQEPTVDAVLEHYVQALGGKANLEKLTSRLATGIFEVPEWETKGPCEVYSKAPNKTMNTTDFAGYGVVARGFNGTSGWSKDPDEGLRDVSGGELAEMKRAAEFHRELKLREQYAKMKLAGAQKLGGQDVQVIEATTPEGLLHKLYFDTQSGLLVRHDMQSEIPGGKMTTVVMLGDYRDVDGVKVPFTIEQNNPNFGFILRLKEVRHNVPVDDAKFEKPAA